jgi:hypothetical protein
VARKGKIDKILKERVAWYKKHLRIRSESGQIVPFDLNIVQKTLERAAIEEELAGTPSYFLILKARQFGCSTWAEAYLFRMAYLLENTRVLVTAHKEDASRNVFAMARRYHEYLPEPPETKRAASNALHLSHNDSEFIVQTAGSGSGAGRSYTFSGWHGSEIDLWPDADALYVAVMQAIPEIGGTIRILESTSEGPGHLMHDLWGKAKSGRSNFRAFFFPWFIHPKYRRALSWAELLAYGPNDWVLKNRETLKITKETQDAVDSIRELRNQRQEGDGGGVGSEDPSPGSQERGESSSLREDEDSPDASFGGYGHRTDDPLGRKSDPGSRPDPSGKGRSTSPRRRGSRVQDETGPDGARIVRTRGHRHSCSDPALVNSLRDSLTDYELGLITEFDITYEQIASLRYLEEVKCNGDADRRKLEYPSRPEEAFSAASGDVLDQQVLADWFDLAEQNPPVSRLNMVPKYDRLGRPIVDTQEDRNGVISIYEWPTPEDQYVLFVDCAQGTSDGDWTVGYVMNVKTGDQAAEYRAKQDPDMAVDQIELLAMLYNRAYTAIEVNGGYGWPFVSHLSQRRHMNDVRLYERTAYDRQEGIRVKVKRPGWDTNTKTRPLLVAASKEAVRKRECRIRSMATIEECQTLHVNMGRGGKVEARPNKHDDGWIAYSGACILRNEVLGEAEFTEEEIERQKYPLFDFVHRNTEARRQHEMNHFAGMTMHEVAKPRVIMPETTDERRSYIG